MKRRLILGFCVFFFISSILSCTWSNKSERNDLLSKQRINTFAQQLTSMAGRAKKYIDTKTIAFVIFIYTDDIFVQAASDEPDRIVIDLPVNIMSGDKINILREIFSGGVYENYAFKPNGPKELISYQIYYQNTDMQKNIHKAAAAIDDIFLKVFGLKSDYSEIKIKTG